MKDIPASPAGIRMMARPEEMHYTPFRSFIKRLVKNGGGCKAAIKLA
jgi:hypothetical protein